MSYIPYCMAWDEEREIKQRSNIEAEYELPYKEMVKSWTFRLVSGWCGIELCYFRALHVRDIFHTFPHVY